MAQAEPTLNITETGAETAPKAAKAPRNRRRGRGEKPAAETTVNSDAIIEAAIPHPTEQLHRHDILEASTALPAVAEAVEPQVAREPREGRQHDRNDRKRSHKEKAPTLAPVQAHDSRRAAVPHAEDDANLVAGHGFGDHLPAFLRRPVRLPARNSGK